MFYILKLIGRCLNIFLFYSLRLFQYYLVPQHADPAVDCRSGRIAVTIRVVGVARCHRHWFDRSRT